MTENATEKTPFSDMPPGLDIPSLPPAGPLAWPLDFLATIFIPLNFYRRGIHRVPLGSSVFGLIFNTLAAMGVFIWALSWSGDLDHIGRDPDGLVTFSLVMLALWVLGVAVVLVGGLIMMPAISGTAGPGQALRRSFRLVASTTAVFPLATLIVAILAVKERDFTRILNVVVSRSNAEFLWSSLFLWPIAWPFGLLFLGLFCDRDPGAAPHEVGGRRCERCGYELVIVSDEGLCPECGRSAAESLDTGRRKPLPVEVQTGVNRCAAVLAGAARGFLVPVRFWWETKVRCDSVPARNSFLACVLMAAGAATILFVVLGIALLSAMGWGADRIKGITVFSLYLFAGLAVLFLAGSQFLILVAIAVATIRGNRLRVDELARVGYQGLAAPVMIEAVWVALTLVLFFVYIESDSYRFAREYGRQAAKLISEASLGAVLLSAVALAVVGVWSLAGIIRAMEAVRHANS